MDGEFLFEPVKLNDKINRVFDPDGYNIEVAAAADGGYYAVIDHTGALCFESDYVTEFSVKNGVLHFNDDGVEIYTAIQRPALY